MNITIEQAIQNFLDAWNALGNDIDITFADGVSHSKEDGFELCWTHNDMVTTYNP